MIIYVAYASADPPLHKIIGDNVHLMMDIKKIYNSSIQKLDETILNRYVSEINQS